jgi:hypothetical protein
LSRPALEVEVEVVAVVAAGLLEEQGPPRMGRIIRLSSKRRDPTMMMMLRWALLRIPSTIEQTQVIHTE